MMDGLWVDIILCFLLYLLFFGVPLAFIIYIIVWAVRMKRTEMTEELKQKKLRQLKILFFAAIGLFVLIVPLSVVSAGFNHGFF